MRILTLALALAPALALAQAPPAADAPVPPPVASAAPARPAPVTIPLEIRLKLYEEDSKTVLGAALLELLTPVPGAGQHYAGTEWWRIAVDYAFLFVPMIVGLVGGQTGVAFGFTVGLFAMKTWAVYDAVRAAHAFNAHLKMQLGLVPRAWPLEERW
jgi:hypothetical protein